MSISRLVIISGVSGSGKSTALNAFEDIGYSVVDNLPVALLDRFAEFLLRDDVGGDARDHALLLHFSADDEFEPVDQLRSKLRAAAIEVSLLFLDADDDVVMRRFKETRRPHPLLKANPELSTIRDALNSERKILSAFRENADRVVDSTSFSPHELRRFIEAHYQGGDTALAPLEVTLVSFGFKYGMPTNADLVTDVRFLPNPHFDPQLRERTGRDSAVRDFVFADESADQFLEKFHDMLTFLLPRYQEEGKRYLTVAVGCTGGRHRSVAVVERLQQLLTQHEVDVVVRHRDADG